MMRLIRWGDRTDSVKRGMLGQNVFAQIVSHQGSWILWICSDNYNSVFRTMDEAKAEAERRIPDLVRLAHAGKELTDDTCLG